MDFYPFIQKLKERHVTLFVAGSRAAGFVRGMVLMYGGSENKPVAIVESPSRQVHRILMPRAARKSVETFEYKTTGFA